MIVWVGLFLMLIVLSVIVSVSNGQAEISFWDVGRILVNKFSHGTISTIKDLPVSSVNIIWFIRMPRILLAIFVGLGLALCGTQSCLSLALAWGLLLAPCLRPYQF